MPNFSIRTKTDPDLDLNQGDMDQHLLATELFQRILWDLCKSAGIFSNDHERAYTLYQRAAFDTALELGCELQIAEKGDETEITFDFIGTITFNEEVDNAGTVDDQIEVLGLNAEQSKQLLGLIGE